MNDITTAAVFGGILGVTGTGLGGLLCLLVKRPDKTLTARLLSLAAGIMLATVFFHLLPEKLDSTIWSWLCGAAAGAILIAGLEYLFMQSGKGSLARLSLLIGIGIAAHNFPEGLAVGGGMAIGRVEGLAVGFAIALHDVPEGFSMGLPMRSGGKNPWFIALMTALSGVPTGIGAGVGAALGGISAGFSCFCSGVAAGAMLSIVIWDMYPEAKKLDPKHCMLWLIAGIAAGVIFNLLLRVIGLEH